jgi:hypothetical protein
VTYFTFYLIRSSSARDIHIEGFGIISDHHKAKQASTVDPSQLSQDAHHYPIGQANGRGKGGIGFPVAIEKLI